MAFDSSGAFSTPFPSFTPNTLIQSAQVNSNSGDVAQALTQLGQGNLNPTVTLTGIPFTTMYGAPVASAWFLIDFQNAGAASVIGKGVNYKFGGAGVFGGRIAAFNSIQNTLATDPANTNRTYVATESYAYTAVGDGGTNTGAGSLGSYIGENCVATLDNGATNVANIIGSQSEVTTVAGSTVRYGRAYSALGNLAVHPADFDAANSVSGLVGHVGWKYGFAFTDIDGASPVYASTTLIGAFWTGATPTVANGVDISNFNFSGSAFKSPGFAVSGTGNVTTLGINTAKQAVTLANGANNNITHTTGSFLRITGPSGVFNITGFVAGNDGDHLYVYNATAQNMTITNNATSTAANQLLTLTGADITQTGTSSCWFIYSSADARWILMGTQA